MTKLHIMTTMDDLKNNWGVYLIFNPSEGKVVYIGYCKLTKLFAIPDARANFAVTSTLGKDTAIVLQILDICLEKGEAIRKHRERIVEYGKPEANIMAEALSNGKILCIDTGEQWATITEAAEAHGVDAGALSRHLRNVPGHITVGGKVYKRATKEI